MHNDTSPITAVDVYRNIHKGIRAELFAVTVTAGNLDRADECVVTAFDERLDRLVWLLDAHAHHEDAFLQPLVEQHAPHLAHGIVQDHAFLDATIHGIAKASKQAVTRVERHEVYLELGAFVSAYLRHQDVEEREVQPALLATVGPQVLFETEQALVASIPPADMATSLSIMLPAMNVDDRAEMLGGMRAGAPAEVFAGVRALAGSVLAPADLTALDHRLGLA